MTRGDWIEGDHCHFPLLHAFVCAPAPWRKIRSLVRRQRPVSEIWAIRVQSRVRDLRPKLKHPNYMYVNLTELDDKIRSVLVYSMAGASERELRIFVYLLATHVDNRRMNLAQQGLDCVKVNAETLAKQNGAEVVHLSAHVDRNNEACRALLLKNGWRQTDQHVDGVHDMWAIRGVLEHMAGS